MGLSNEPKIFRVLKYSLLRFAFTKELKNLWLFIGLNSVEKNSSEENKVNKENDDVEEQGLNETVNYVNKSQEAIFIIHRYEDIIKTPNKKAIGYFDKQGELLSSKIMLVKADQQCILKFHFISF